MYYVIKQQHDAPLNHFVGFIVEKFIASKNNEHIIFEFTKNGKPERKWVKKVDIILLTEDKEFFIETLNKFKIIQNEQRELVTQAQEELNLSLEHSAEVMNEEIDKFNELKLSDDIPCIIKDY